MTSHPSDADLEHLLAQAAQGDEQAFATLMDGHRHALRAMIHLRLNAELARRCDVSDVVQETQMEAFRRLRDFVDRRPMPFCMWLKRIARNQLITLRRRHVAAAKRSIRREVPIADHSSVILARSMVGSGLTPSGVLATRETHRRLQQALAELKDDDREMLLMRYVENLSNREIALLLGISENAASKRHGAALLRLRQTMKQCFPGGTDS